MEDTSQHHHTEVLVRLSPEDIRTIRTGLRVLLQIRTRREGYAAIHHALADLPDEDRPVDLEAGEGLHALACACRDAGLCDDRTPVATELPGDLAGVQSGCGTDGKKA